MKKLIPAQTGHPVINDDVVFIQDIFKEYSNALLKGYTSPSGYIILSGCVVTEDSPGMYVWTDGYVYSNTGTVYYLKSNEIPVSLNPAHIAIETSIEDITSPIIKDLQGNVVQTRKFEYAFLMEDSGGSLLSDTPKFTEVMDDALLLGDIRTDIAEINQVKHKKLRVTFPVFNWDGTNWVTQISHGITFGDHSKILNTSIQMNIDWSVDFPYGMYDFSILGSNFRFYANDTIVKVISSEANPSSDDLRSILEGSVCHIVFTHD